MTENVKRFLEEASKDKDLIEKVNAATEAETLIALAKEKGFVLTKEDLEAQPEALSEEELDTVVGGDFCMCMFGGGGSSSWVLRQPIASGSRRYNKTCACVVAGVGEYEDYIEYDVKEKTSTRCLCSVYGTGSENVT